MKLDFELVSDTGTQPLAFDCRDVIIAGWAGRDAAAVQHHIAELAAIGVLPPSRVPLYYRVAANQLTQRTRVQVLGEHSSGEAEALIFSVGGTAYVSLTSDHTDRKLEALSVAAAKQACAKPVARSAWRLADVLPYWDELTLRVTIIEDAEPVLYQQGPLASLRTPLDLIADYTGGAGELPDGSAMSCGTLAAIGGIRPARVFDMTLHDPRRNRTIEHRYELDVLPVVR